MCRCPPRHNWWLFEPAEQTPLGWHRCEWLAKFESSMAVIQDWLWTSRWWKHQLFIVRNWLWWSTWTQTSYVPVGLCDAGAPHFGQFRLWPILRWLVLLCLRWWWWLGKARWGRVGGGRRFAIHIVKTGSVFLISLIRSVSLISLIQTNICFCESWRIKWNKSRRTCLGMSHKINNQWNQLNQSKKMMEFYYAEPVFNMNHKKRSYFQDKQNSFYGNKNENAVEEIFLHVILRKSLWKPKCLVEFVRCVSLGRGAVKGRTFFLSGEWNVSLQKGIIFKEGERHVFLSVLEGTEWKVSLTMKEKLEAPWFRKRREGGSLF